MMFEINKNPSPREIRQTGYFFGGGFLLIAAFLYWRNHAEAAAVILAISTAPALWMLIWPATARMPYLAWMYFGYALGRITSPIFLRAIFYLVFTPFSVVFRLVGRDSLALKRDPQATTYWVEHAPLNAPKFLERQS